MKTAQWDHDKMYEKIHALLSNKDCSFVPSGPSIGEIAALAAGIRENLGLTDAEADEPVCLCVEDRSALLASLLACIAGAPRFIIPHSFHPAVLAEVYEALPFRLILTDTDIDPPDGVKVIRLDMCRRIRRPLAWARQPEEPFIYLFTGGSTGTPRMWSKTPANLFGEAFYLADTFGLGHGDLLLSTVPPQHIYGLLYSVLLPFCAGAKVLSGTLAFPREILGALQTEGTTVLVSAPVHYRALKNGDLHRSSLRLACSSTAPLDTEDAAFFRKKTGLPVTEIYGSTETGGVAFRTSGKKDGPWEPFACLDWKTSSERLCVRSGFVSPDLPRDEEGFFMTSDRAAPAGENRFKLLGRMDSIVKIAGKRVDLDAVRERILRIPGIRDAHLAAFPLRKGRQTEIAALVVSDLAVETIKTAFRSLEDPYGRPRRIKVVPSIPVLPNGKIDRQRIDRLLASLARPETIAT